MAPGASPGGSDSQRMATSGGHIIHLVPEDDEHDPPRFPIVIGWNGVNHYIPTFISSPTNIIKWKIALLQKHLDAIEDLYGEIKRPLATMAPELNLKLSNLVVISSSTAESMGETKGLKATKLSHLIPEVNLRPGREDLTKRTRLTSINVNVAPNYQMPPEVDTTGNPTSEFTTASDSLHFHPPGVQAVESEFDTAYREWTIYEESRKKHEKQAEESRRNKKKEQRKKSEVGKTEETEEYSKTSQPKEPEEPENVGAAPVGEEEIKETEESRKKNVTESVSNEAEGQSEKNTQETEEKSGAKEPEHIQEDPVDTLGEEKIKETEESRKKNVTESVSIEAERLTEKQTQETEGKSGAEIAEDVQEDPVASGGAEKIEESEESRKKNVTESVSIEAERLTEKQTQETEEKSGAEIAEDVQEDPVASGGAKKNRRKRGIAQKKRY